MFRKPVFFRSVCAILACAAIAGCGETVIEYTETKRIDEKVTDGELEAFLRVINRLPERRLPDLPPVFASTPNWTSTRTLPVSELIHEEQSLLAERWTTEWLSRQWHRNRALARALQGEQMTLDQLSGLVLTLGAAISRSTLREDQDLKQLLERGEAVIEALRTDKEPFDDHSREGQHNVLRQAAWITRVDRAYRLGLVPPENVALVNAHRDELWRIFPAQFTMNPLDSIADHLEEKGVPFEELDESDEHLSWDPEQAIVGRDRPDGARRAASTAGYRPRRAANDGEFSVP